MMLQLVKENGQNFSRNRWWIYQKERFPIFKYGLLVAVFSGSAISYSQLLQESNTIDIRLWLATFLVTFSFFVQMRIADEFKDYKDDCKYRPERAIPRGLVGLQELGEISILLVFYQLEMVWIFIPQTFPYLCLVWGYFFLMCLEFCCRHWLKKHLSVYMLSHMIILPLIGLFNLMASGQLQVEYGLFCIVCFLNGMVIEIGRKICAPKYERVGVETYSSVWGSKIATLIWLSCIVLSAIATAFSAYQINFATPVIATLTPFTLASIWFSHQFIQQLNSQSAKRIDQMSALWILMSYLSLGLFPLLIRI